MRLFSSDRPYSSGTLNSSKSKRKRINLSTHSIGLRQAYYTITVFVHDRAVMAEENKEQRHPQWSSDRRVTDALLTGEPSDYNLAELARLKIRYKGFPGARDIQSDLEKILSQWHLTEETLCEKTREIHAVAQVYKGRGAKRDDWS
jgi:hypothetical protein